VKILGPPNPKAPPGTSDEGRTTMEASANDEAGMEVPFWPPLPVEEDGEDAF
jgi:hypothetical protein